MVKVFISQPMADRTDNIKSLLPGEEIEVIDSFFEGAPHDAKPLWFLGKSLQLLSTADVAYFIDDWDKYRGCRIENFCAHEYGVKVFEQCRIEVVSEE